MTKRRPARRCESVFPLNSFIKSSDEGEGEEGAADACRDSGSVSEVETRSIGGLTKKLFNEK